MDRFSYTVDNGHGETATATVTVTAQPNNPPVANDDAINTLPDSLVVIPVLGNDTDSDGDTLTLAGATQPANGAVALNDNNTVSYTPAAGFSGTDRFTYTVSDGRGGTATGTVTVIVGNIMRVSVSSDGAQSGGIDDYFVKIASLNADGRYVAFYPGASNLTLGDTNGTWDIFVHDRQTGQTTRVSVASDGAQGNGNSWRPFLSADGRYVLFASGASNLAPDDTNNVEDIFVHDRQTGQTTRVSVASDGTQGNYPSNFPSLSADGRYVAFESHASNLAPDDTNGEMDIFVHDRQTGQTTRVSVASDGAQSNGLNFMPSFSADGRYVVFASFASNLVAEDSNGTGDLFMAINPLFQP